MVGSNSGSIGSVRDGGSSTVEPPPWFIDVDDRRAIEVTHRTWWVGAPTADDPFQCHPYLIEAGDRSVLVDPGSTSTIDVTLDKIRDVVPIDHIATILLNHSDPDCADAIHRLGEVLSRDDVKIVTEWRSEPLLRSLAPKFPITTIEDLGGRLDLGDRGVLRFALTPYLHFPGAFVTFDPTTRALFTGDLFGGFNTARRLVMSDAEQLDDIRRFHEHYMPSREILMAGLAVIRDQFPDIDVVLPQHGAVLAGPMIDAAFEALVTLECGVMSMARADAGLAGLLDAAAIVREIERAIDGALRPSDVVQRLEDVVVAAGLATGVAIDVRGTDGRSTSVSGTGARALRPMDGPSAAGVSPWSVPIRDDADGVATLVVHDPHPARLTPELRSMLDLMRTPLLTSLSRQVEMVRADVVRESWEFDATHDPLTGLSNRRTIPEILGAPSAVLMIDIDHFKSFNDTWGHTVGDGVLRDVAAAVRRSVRPADRVIRFGGEEILVIADIDDGEDRRRSDPGCESLAVGCAERIRHAVRSMVASDQPPGRQVTVSVGVAVASPGEHVVDVIARADAALYDAKQSGRDRVCCARNHGKTIS